MNIKEINITVNKHETLILRDALIEFLDGRENCSDSEEIKKLTKEFRELVLKF